MSGEWSSIMVTMPEREGLLAPAFCALSVSIVNFIAVGRAAASDWACPSLTCVPCGVFRVSVDGGLAVGEARVCAIPRWVAIPVGVNVFPAGKDAIATSGNGEPGGEWGKGSVVSLLESGRMTKVGSSFHPMLCRLLGRRRVRGAAGGRTGNELGMRVGQ
jgi:hypothetical protein